MNTEREELRKMSQVWRTGRLIAGMTQQELSKELDISQSSISKYESLQLEPSASDWYKFCQFIGINAHRSLELGYIDGKKKFKHRLYSDSQLTLPLKYRQDYLLKVRDLIPVKDCVVTEIGIVEWNNFLKELKIPPEIFYVYDLQISFNFLKDILSWSNQNKFKLLAQSKKYSGNLENHGLLEEDYKKKKSGADLLKSVIDNQAYYQRVFSAETAFEEGTFSCKVNLSSEALSNFSQEELEPYIGFKVATFQEIIRKNQGLKKKLEMNERDFSFKVKL